MEKTGFDSFLSDIREYHVLSPVQQQNVQKLLLLSENFSRKAGLPLQEPCGFSPDTLILESGHQPNFLPYAGTWKKAFLLNYIHDRLVQDGRQAIAFFGLADQNISTARVLAKNQVPDLNKNGFLKIGFRIPDTEKTRSFNRVAKPAKDEFTKEIERIYRYYKKIQERTKFSDIRVIQQWDDLYDTFLKSYDRAENFAELNAILFARICYELNINHVSFFLYSDMHHGKLFLEESRDLLKNAERFNQVYNNAISSSKLDIPPVRPNRLPFWYECACGVKLDLLCDTAGTCEITCPSCGHHDTLRFGPGYENLEDYYEYMDFNAVSRNIIMARGLGVSLFISGTGGSFTYGQVSESISSHLGYHRPVALAWQSKDYYFGMIHKTAVWELMKTFSLSAGDFFPGTLDKKVRLAQDRISDNIKNSDADAHGKERRYWTGVQNSADNLIDYSQKLFSGTPSFIDILANYDHDTIISLWEKSIYSSGIVKTGYLSRIITDIWYPVLFLQGRRPDEIGDLYGAVINLGVQ